MNQNEGQGWRLITAASTSMDSARNWGWALKWGKNGLMKKARLGVLKSG